MATTLPAFTPLEDSLWLTLCCRALDNRRSQDELLSLLDRLIDHSPSGEMVFNSYTTFAVWAARHSPGTKSVAEFPPALRWYYRLQARSTSWSRKGTIILHHRF